MSTGEKYVAGAYGAFVLMVLFWVVIVAAKLARLERETAALARLADEHAPETERADG